MNLRLDLETTASPNIDINPNTAIGEIYVHKTVKVNNSIY